VPQKELYHYSSNVRALTSGRGRHAETFSHYAELPPDFAQRLLNDLRAKRNGGAEKEKHEKHEKHAMAHAH
jgi:elongation factor G